MTVRRLGAEERALWAKVIATVRPIAPRAKSEAPEAPISEDLPKAPKPAAKRKPPAPVAAPRPRAVPGTTLDGTWDRKLGKGAVAPDIIVDLHGHNLATAYDLLDRRLEEAVTDGARVILLVTGRAPQGDRHPVARGAIRAAVGDWLAASRHARHIAAIRGAHPRHGGAGALYIILRRS